MDDIIWNQNALQTLNIPPSNQFYSISITILIGLTSIFTSNPVALSLSFAIFIPFSSSTTIYWAQSNNTLPTATSGMASGYNNISNSIFLIGGYQSKRDVIEYEIETNTFITSQDNVVDYIHGYSQFYSQNGHNIYIYLPTSEYIAIYNMLKGTYEGIKIKEDAYVGFPCIASANQYIYVLGGQDINKGSIYDKVTIYDMNISEWINITSYMLHGRRFHSCNVHNGLIYSIGGDNNGNYLDSVEFLNVSDMNNLRKWEELNGKLSVARYGLRSVIYRDYIYVIGGYDGRNFISEVDIIDTKKHSITLASNLITAAYSVSAAVGNDMIYVFGGFNGNMGYLNTIQLGTQITLKPTSNPTLFPTTDPTLNPTFFPTLSPTFNPSFSPTFSPTAAPSLAPSRSPSRSPSIAPSIAPSL
eukprot:326017_1